MLRPFTLLLLYVTCLPLLLAQQLAPITVNYCIDPAWAPYESIENQQHVGISKQYLALIEQRSALKFQLKVTQSWEETLALAKTGDCQLLPMLNRSPNREQYLIFSDIYFRAPNALYSHYDQLMIGNLSSIESQTVAVVAGYRMHHYLMQTFPDMKLVTVENEAIGLQKTANKEVDYFVGSFYAANNIIQELSLSQLRIVGIAELEDNLRMGVAKNSAHLLPMINQALAQLTDEDHNQVYNYLKMSNLVKQTDYTVVVKTTIAFTLIILVLLSGFIYSRRQALVLAEKNRILKQLHQVLADKNKQLAELAIRDPLTQLYNRSHLAEVIEQQIRLKNRYNTTACLIMIDIDDFKEVNDNMGHAAGDEILQQFALTLSHCARDSDIAARWGGEEFVLLCPKTDLSEAKVIAERFQQVLTSQQKSTLPLITCSIGIAELDGTASADQWFISADNAMYLAKGRGKNTIYCIES